MKIIEIRKKEKKSLLQIHLFPKLKRKEKKKKLLEPLEH